MSSFLRHHVLAGLLAVALLALTGCGGMISDIARPTTSGVIDGAIDGLSDPENQAKILNALEAKMVADATQRISAGVIDGALAALSEKDRQAELAVLAGQAENMANRMLSGSMDTIMGKLMNDAMEKRIKSLVTGIVTEVLVAVITTVKKELGPIELPTSKTIGEGAREVTKQITLGFQDAVDQTRRDRASGAIPENEGSVLFGMGEFAENGGGSMLYTIAGGFAALLIALAGMFYWVSRRFRAHQAELGKRDEALLLLTQAIKSTEDKPWAGELRHTIKQTMADKEAGDHLRKVLRNNRELRLSSPVRDPARPIGHA